jgi:hypothetical protein
MRNGPESILLKKFLFSNKDRRENGAIGSGTIYDI